MSGYGKWLVLGAVVLGSAVAWQAIDTSGASGKRLPGESEENEAHERDNPGAFADMWAARLEGTGSLSPAQINLDVNYEVQAARQQAPNGTSAPAFGFDPLGPGNFGGRSRSLVIHPTLTNQILVGSVSGGVWRSDTEGASWRPVGDFLANIAVNSMTLDPDNANRVFAGTGEGVGAGDAARGAGIFVSQDFGLSWTQLASTANPDFYYVNRIAMVPGTDVIVAATRTGLWRSTNLGTSWTRVATAFYTDDKGYSDVKSDPGTAGRMLAYSLGSAGGRGAIPQIDIGVLPIISGVKLTWTTAFPVAFTAQNLRNANDGTAPVTDGCTAYPAGFFSGRYALVDRGSCTFVVKVQNAQAAGALGVVIVQNTGDAPFAGAGDPTGITIPGMMISLADGNRIRAAITASGPLFANGFEDAPAAGADQLAVQVGGPLVLTNFIARSTDGGATWTQLTLANGLPESTVGRAELGWGPGGVAYAAFATDTDTTLGLWRSNDGGLNWAQTASTAAFIERQGDYDLAVLVDPANANKVYMGAIDLWITTDGGTTITQSTEWAPQPGQMPVYVHADHHGYFAKPGAPNTVYTVSDGGVHRSTDGGVNYAELNFGYDVAMPNNISVSADGTRAVVGTQDNGSMLWFGDRAVWLEWSGGDGGNTAFDQQNPNFIYSERPFADFFGSSDLGNTEADLPIVGAGSGTNGGLFYAPVVIDRNDGNRMLIGTGILQFSTNVRQLATSTWTSITMPAGFGSINTIAFGLPPAPGAPATYAFAGSTSGAIVRVSNLGSTNTVASIQGNLPLGNDISQIIQDPADATGNTIFVVLADYGTNRVFRTTNGGAAWTSIHGNLPDIPMFSIALDPGVPGNLLVGSELGLWYGIPSGGTYDWARFDYGVPYTRVFGITPFGNDTFFIAVYGRGSFKATRSPLRVSIGELRGDVGCDADGNLDPLETAMLPVTVTNLAGSTVGPINLSVASSLASLSFTPTVIPSLAANASTTVMITNPPWIGAPACPAPATFTATAAIAGASSTATRTVGVDVQTPVVLSGFVDGAEGVTSRFENTKTVGPDLWQRVTNQVHTGTASYFAADLSGYSEKFLTSPWVNVTSPTASLSFWIRYFTEGDSTQRWDGVVLEARTRANIDGTPGAWVDIGATGTVPYDGALFFNTTLGPSRPAWSGDQQTWRQSTLTLGAYNGQQLQFRFRFVSDQSATEQGFWLDDVSATGVSFRDLPTCDNTCN